MGSAKINFSGHFVRAANDLHVETPGTALSNRVAVFSNTVLQARNLTVMGGNRFEARKSAALKASERIHVQAQGCKIHARAILEGGSFFRIVFECRHRKPGPRGIHPGQSPRRGNSLLLHVQRLLLPRPRRQYPKLSVDLSRRDHLKRGVGDP